MGKKDQRRKNIVNKKKEFLLSVIIVEKSTPS